MELGLGRVGVGGKIRFGESWGWIGDELVLGRLWESWVDIGAGDFGSWRLRVGVGNSCSLGLI